MYLNTSVRVASQTLVCSLFCAVGQLFRETRVLIMVCGLSLVSTSVEHALQKRGTVSLVFLFLCILRYPSLCAVLSSVHKSRSVVKLRWCPQNRFKSCPFVSPSGKVLRCSHHSLSSSLVLCSVSWYIAPSPLGKLCREQVLCPRTLSSANPCLLCTSRSAESFVWSIRVLSKYETCLILSSAHSVKCETCLLVSPRTL